MISSSEKERKKKREGGKKRDIIENQGENLLIGFLLHSYQSRMNNIPHPILHNVASRDYRIEHPLGRSDNL